MAVNYNLMEVTCQKAVSGSNFGQGTQDFIFTLGAPNCFFPSKSYFKVDMQVTGSGNKPLIPQVSDGIALADNVVGNLYSNAYMKFEGQDVSSITSFLSQTSALKKRLFKSQGWLKTIGQGACDDLASQLSRCYLLSGGVPGDNNNGETSISLKGCSNSDYATATIISIDNAGLVTGGASSDWLGAGNAANAILPGDVLYILNNKFTVAEVNSANTLHVAQVPTAAFIADLAAATPTTKFYFIRQSRDTNTSKNIISVLWVPPLGIFDYREALGSGSYKISLTPDANYLNNAVETKNTSYNNTSGVVANSFNFSIIDVKFYAYQAKTASIPEGPQTLDLLETLTMSKPLIAGANNFQFSVPPSTTYITVFAQDNRTGSSPLYPPSMFKCSSLNNPLVSGDMTLTNIQLVYSSITKPSTNWSSAWNTDGVDVENKANPALVPSSQTNQMVQRFYDSFLEFQNSANSGFGTETFNEWAQRGPFHMYVFARDQSDRSTEVQLNVTYRDITNSNIFLCAWYHNTVQYTVNNGMITSLSSRQV